MLPDWDNKIPKRDHANTTYEMPVSVESRLIWNICETRANPIKSPSTWHYRATNRSGVRTQYLLFAGHIDASGEISKSVHRKLQPTYDEAAWLGLLEMEMDYKYIPSKNLRCGWTAGENWMPLARTATLWYWVKSSVSQYGRKRYENYRKYHPDDCQEKSIPFVISVSVWCEKVISGWYALNLDVILKDCPQKL